MTITITITGDARTVRNELAELIGAMPPRVTEMSVAELYQAAKPTGGVIQTPTDDTQAGLSVTEAPPAEGKPLTGEVMPPEEKPKRRGRPAKAEAEAPAPGSVIADYRAAMEAEQAAPMTAAEAETVMHPDAVQEPKEVPLEAVQDAIRSVAARFDTDACKDLLRQFGAGKSSEVKPADRAAFVQAAKEWKR